MTLYDKDEASDLTPSKERTFRKPPVPGTASPSSGAAASRLRTAQASSFEYQKKPARWPFQVARRSENTGLD
jgi:hypothetical protein